MDGKSPRLAASAVSVVVAASIMLLTQRPRLGRIFSESVPLLCCEHEENSGTSWMKDSGRSGVSSRVGRTHPSICRAQNVETEKPKVKRAHCDLSATYLCILTESHITPTTPPLSTLFGDGWQSDERKTWIGRCPIFDLVLAGPRVTEEDEKKIPNQLSYNSQILASKDLLPPPANCSCRLRCVGKILAFYVCYYSLIFTNL